MLLPDQTEVKAKIAARVTEKSLQAAQVAFTQAAA